jgi:hypothetical protein
MSLCTEGNTESNAECTPICNILHQGKVVDQIGYYDEDAVDILNRDDPTFRPLRRITLDDPEQAFFPIVRDYYPEEQVDTIYVSGTTGCGKSSWIRAYIKAFNIKYPKAKIWLFTCKSEDKVFTGLPIRKIDIDEGCIDEPITMDDMSAAGKPSLCIFDDIEDYATAKINKEVARLRDQVMRCGRSFGIFSVFVQHDPAQGKATKAQLFECNKVVIFPKRCGKNAYKYLLEKKLGLDTDLIHKINTLRSNYVCISKMVPRFIISDKYILLDM